MPHIDQAPAGSGSQYDAASEDRRMATILKQMQTRVPEGEGLDYAADVHRTRGMAKQHFPVYSPLTIGTILHAVPYLNSYKVQLGDLGGCVTCTHLNSVSSMLPIGVRCTGLLPPNTAVAVWRPQHSRHGYIVGVIPTEIQHYDVPSAIAGWVQQGGGSGFKRELAHLQPIKNLYREGGTRNWSNGRPLDQTCFDWGMQTETGLGLHIDPFQTYLRVNEACGIYFNFWDSYAKLIALQLEIQSYPYHLHAQEDEGENQCVELGCIYPWESLGNAQPEQTWTKENSAQDVHYKTHEGKIDVDNPQRQPIARYQEHSGYPGQGRLRLMMVPKAGAKGTSQAGTGTGVWEEHIALDGSYTNRSAKSVYIAKYSEIPLPERLVRAEDQQQGQADDKRQNNYCPSGWQAWADGAELHNLQEPKIDADPKHMLHVAGVCDLLSYHYNWKAYAGFYYHAKDWTTPEEGEGPCGQGQHHVNFTVLENQTYLDYPTPQTLKVDHRFQDVNYFPTEVYLAMHEDGSLVLGDGYGSQIVMSGGQIRLEPAADLMCLPGRRMVTLCWDSITRAANSVDISATAHDVRIKAEKNVQIVAGNSGQEGGVLIESKALQDSQVYDQLYGEQVVSSGIVLLAKHSTVANLGKELYLRTGGGQLDDGRITIDASKGNKELVIYGKRADFFLQNELNIWQGPQGESSNVTANHRFGLTNSIISGSLLVEKSLVVFNGGLAVSESAVFGGSLWARSLAQKNNIFTGKIDFSSEVQRIISLATTARDEHKSEGTPAFEGEVDMAWYISGMLGDESLLEKIGFSFRDPPGEGIQYKTTQFVLPETNWQRWINLGQGSGGVAWTEKPVTNQGTETYPWPGKQQWVDSPSYLQYQPSGMRSYISGISAPRPQKYNGQPSGHSGGDGSPQPLGHWTPQTADGTYKLILAPNS